MLVTVHLIIAGGGCHVEVVKACGEQGGALPGLATLGVFVCAYFHTVVRVQQQKSRRAAEINCERGELLFPIAIIIAAQTRKGAAFGLEGHGKKTESTHCTRWKQHRECARACCTLQRPQKKRLGAQHHSGEERKRCPAGWPRYLPTGLACEGLQVTSYCTCLVWGWLSRYSYIYILT